MVGLSGEPVTAGRALLWLACGVVLLGAVWTNFAYLAFWFEAANLLHDLVIATFGAGRYPVAFFPSLIRALLVFVVPVGVATSLPVQSVVGTVSPAVGIAAVALTVVFVLLTRLHWRLALRRYASASS